MSTISLTKPKSVEATTVWPQVDLLPPEVRQARRSKRTKALLVLGVILVALLGLLGWIFARFQLLDANQELATVQDETTRLEQEQQSYAEVPRVKAQLSTVEQALSTAAGHEVLWKRYLEAFRAVTPGEVSYDNLSAAVSEATSQAAAAQPLQQPSIGQITFSARSTKLVDTAAWMDAVEQVPGLSDPWFTQATITDEGGQVYYQVTGTVQVNDVALAHRFQSDDAAQQASGDQTPVEPSAAPTTGGNS